MVVAAICPVHGPFESRGYTVENSTQIQFIGVQEQCPVPGCGKTADVMEGTYSFRGPSTIVHEAPPWSIHALRAVEASIAEALRVATDPKTTDHETKNAFDKAVSLTRINSHDAPPEFKTAFFEILNLGPLLKTKGYKRGALLALAALSLLLTSYTDMRDNIDAIFQDVYSTAQFIIEHGQALSEDVKEQVRSVMDEIDE